MTNPAKRGGWRQLLALTLVWGALAAAIVLWAFAPALPTPGRCGSNQTLADRLLSLASKAL